MKISKQAGQGLAIAVFTILLMLALFEAGTRMIAGIPLADATNFIETQRVFLKGTYESQYDPVLGWIPKPGAYQPEDNIWQTRVTIGQHGIRSNGPSAALTSESPHKMLAVGDSFTFGDEVSDDETWPAKLEEMSGAQVINAGVFSYGVDQSILRAEMLVDEYEPELLVISLIPDDIKRAELSLRGSAAKPYFEIVDDQLVLENVPPDPARLQMEDLSALHRLLGHSAFLNLVLNVAGQRNAWYGIDPQDHRVHEKGVDVSCHLLQRVGELGESKGFQTMLLVQYTQNEIFQPQAGAVQTVITCAQESEIAVLDLYPHLKQIAETDSELYEGLYATHMTPDGNKVVADRLFEYLIQSDTFSPPAGE